MTDDIVHVGRHRRPLVQEAPQHAHAVRRVDDLGVELHAVDAPGVVLERRRPGRRRSSAVAMNPAGASVIASKWLIHTSWTSGASSGSSSDGAGAAQLGPAVLAAHAAPDGAAELLGDQLGAVADAEDRDAELVDRRVERRRARRRGRSSGRRTGSARPAGRAATSAAVMRLRHDLGEHVQLAHPAGDELGVLGAEVDDEDGVLVAGGGRSVGRRLGQGLDRSRRW